MVYAYIYCVKCVAKCVVSPVANFYEFSGDDSLEEEVEIGWEAG